LGSDKINGRAANEQFVKMANVEKMTKQQQILWFIEKNDRNILWNKKNIVLLQHI